MGRATLALLSALLLSGCSSGEAPAGFAEYAVQGTYTAALSDDGRHALIGSIQHGGSLWDTSADERLYNWNHRKGEFSIIAVAAFSPEGDYALTADQQSLVLWQTRDGQPVWYWSAPAEILAAGLTLNGDLALLGLANHEAVLFDVKNGGIRQTLRHDGRVRAVAISPDGRFALTGGDDNLARLWDLESGRELKRQSFDNGVNTVAFAPDGRTLFSAGELNKAIIWDADSGNLRQTLTSDERFVAQRISYTAAAFSPDSRQLLTGTSSGVVQLWDVAGGKVIRSWKLHKRDPMRPTAARTQAVAFADSGYLAIGSNGFLNRLR